MTTHQLTGVGDAGDALPLQPSASKAFKAVGAAAAALALLGATALAGLGNAGRAAAARADVAGPVRTQQGRLTTWDLRSPEVAPAAPAASPAPAAPGAKAASPVPAAVPTARPSGPPASVVRTPIRSLPSTNRPRPGGSGVVNGRPAPKPAPSGPPTTQGPAGPPPGSSSRGTPQSQDPSQSVPPSAAFDANCFGSSYSASACDQAALADIDNALSSEGYGPLSLPSNYSSLSMAAQLIAVANAERTVRGLPAMSENSSLDSRAYQGAQAGADPTGPSGYAWGSNLATGYPTALSADYVWMYDDGANSPNVDCQSAGASGCWGHRHNILIQGGGQAGAAIYVNNGTVNLTQLFVVNY